MKKFFVGIAVLTMFAVKTSASVSDGAGTERESILVRTRARLAREPGLIGFLDLDSQNFITGDFREELFYHRYHGSPIRLPGRRKPVVLFSMHVEEAPTQEMDELKTLADAGDQDAALYYSLCIFRTIERRHPLYTGLKYALQAAEQGHEGGMYVVGEYMTWRMNSSSEGLDSPMARWSHLRDVLGIYGARQRLELCCTGPEVDEAANSAPKGTEGNRHEVRLGVAESPCPPRQSPRVNDVMNPGLEEVTNLGTTGDVQPGSPGRVEGWGTAIGRRNSSPRLGPALRKAVYASELCYNQGQREEWLMWRITH